MTRILLALLLALGLAGQAGAQKVDNSILRQDATPGATYQQSGVLIDDSNVIISNRTSNGPRFYEFSRLSGGMPIRTYGPMYYSHGAAPHDFCWTRTDSGAVNPGSPYLCINTTGGIVSFVDLGAASLHLERLDQHCNATAKTTVVDYTGLSGAVLTVKVAGTPTTLTEGSEWTAATSNAATATSLATAIAGISGITAANTYNGEIVFIESASEVLLSSNNAQLTTTNRYQAVCAHYSNHHASNDWTFRQGSDLTGFNALTIQSNSGRFDFGRSAAGSIGAGFSAIGLAKVHIRNDTHTSNVPTLIAEVGPANVKVVDWTQLSGVTLTVAVTTPTAVTATTILTEGVDWTAATSNIATADSLEAAIDAISGIQLADADGGTVIDVTPDAGSLVTLTSSDDTNLDATAAQTADPIQARSPGSSSADLFNVTARGRVNAKRTPLDPSVTNWFLDQFHGDQLDDRWASFTGSDPQATVTMATAFTGGVVQLTTGDDAAASLAVNGTEIVLPSLWKASQGGVFFETRVALNTITNISTFFGFTDEATILEQPILSAASGDTITSPALNAVGFMFDTAMATDNWWLVGTEGNVDATHQNVGSAPVANTFAVLRVELDTNGNATFFINGTQVGTKMADAVNPAVGVYPTIVGFRRTASSGVIRSAYVYTGGTEGN